MRQAVEHSPVAGADTWIIMTESGVTLSCSPRRSVGDGFPVADYWSVLTVTGARFIGPPFDRGTTAPECQRLMSSWWNELPAAARDRANAYSIELPDKS